LPLAIQLSSETEPQKRPIPPTDRGLACGGWIEGETEARGEVGIARWSDSTADAFVAGEE